MIKLPEALRVALVHALKVFIYAGVSAVVPIILAYAENDPKWVALTPAINAGLYALLRYLKERGWAFASKLA